jgi:hypothetical protein
VWFLPTYGRPGRCQEALDSIIAAGASAPGIVLIDGDEDPAYLDLRLPGGWSLSRSHTNRGLCGVLNSAFADHYGEPWFGFISDDSVLRAGPGWDQHLIDAAGLSGFANSGDGWQAVQRMHGAVVFGGDLVRALGWIAPPGLVHSFCDDAWERLGRALGNWTHVPSVLVEHRHSVNGKAPDDPTYAKAYSTFQADRAAFVAFLAGDFRAALRRAEPVAATLDLGARVNSRARHSPVMICTPVYRDCSWQYTRSLVNTCLTLDRAGIHHRVQMVIGNSNLPRARNELAAAFLASDCATMIFIDSDMGWSQNDVLRLLGSDKPLIGGVGRKRSEGADTDPEVWCCRFMSQEITQDQLGAIEVAGVGTGFMKIDREVFETITRARPALKLPPLKSMAAAVGENYHEFFAFGDGIGEDYLFCNRWREVGGQVWIDPEIALTHVGSHEFRGSVSALLEPE